MAFGKDINYVKIFATYEPLLRYCFNQNFIGWKFLET